MEESAEMMATFCCEECFIICDFCTSCKDYEEDGKWGTGFCLLLKKTVHLDDGCDEFVCMNVVTQAEEFIDRIRIFEGTKDVENTKT